MEATGTIWKKRREDDPSPETLIRSPGVYNFFYVASAHSSRGVILCLVRASRERTLVVGAVVVDEVQDRMGYSAKRAGRTAQPVSIADTFLLRIRHLRRPVNPCSRWPLPRDGDRIHSGGGTAAAMDLCG